MSKGKIIIEPQEAKLTRDVANLVKMDPYVKITMGEKTWQTYEHKNGGKTPEWKE